jgi:hypothetical protein
MKFHFNIKHRGMFVDLQMMTAQWARQSECQGLMDKVIKLKRDTITAQHPGANINVYPSLCGYLQAVSYILAAHYPKEAQEWLIKEANTLENDLPFVILKYSKPKEEQ